MNIHTYLEKRASMSKVKRALNMAMDIAETQGHTAVSTAFNPVTMLKDLRSAIKQGGQFRDMAILMLPGAALGYTPYAYGAYKGGKKVKDYLNDKRGKR